MNKGLKHEFEVSKNELVVINEQFLADIQPYS